MATTNPVYNDLDFYLDDTGGGSGGSSATPSDEPSIRIGEFVWLTSAAGRTVDDGYLPVKAGTVSGGAALYPIWAAMYPEFVSGADIVFPANVEGMFLRNLGGNSGSEGVAQPDATAANGLRYGDLVGMRVSVPSSGGFYAVGNGDTGGANSVGADILAQDVETRPANRAYQLYTIVDTYQNFVDGRLVSPTSLGVHQVSQDLEAVAFDGFEFRVSAVDQQAQMRYVGDGTGALVNATTLYFKGDGGAGNSASRNITLDANWVTVWTDSTLVQAVIGDHEELHFTHDGVEYWMQAIVGNGYTNNRIVIERKSQQTIVSPDTVPVEDVRVLLGSGSALANGDTVTISDTWGNLATTYESVHFEFIGVAGTDPYRVGQTVPVSSWVDDTDVVLNSDATVLWQLLNMDAAGNTATVNISGAATVTAADVNVYGVKPQKNVLSTVDVEVDLTGVADGDQFQWNAAANRMEPATISEELDTATAAATLNQLSGPTWTVTTNDSPPDGALYLVRCQYTQEGKRRFYSVHFRTDNDNAMSFGVIGAVDVHRVSVTSTTGQQNDPNVGKIGVNAIGYDRSNVVDSDQSIFVSFMAIMP